MAKKRQPAPPVPDPLERYARLMAPAEFAAMMATLREPLPQALRANPLKVKPAAAIQDWAARYGWEIQPVPFCPDGWQVLSARVPPSATIEFKLGQFYIQDAASMLPAELFDFAALPAEPLLLDLAAAPGGKTTQLIGRSGDRGLAVANDSSPGRIPALRGVLRDWGAVSAAVTAFSGERFGAWFPERFDAALLDAPCTMENLRPDPGRAPRVTTQRERSDLAGRQLRLLVSAVRAVKVGGQIVYATCSLAPEEDEAVIDGLLRLFPGGVEIVDLSARLPRPAPGLARDEEREYGTEVQRSVRLWPHRYGTSGFFAALIRKTDSLPGEEQSPPQRPLERSGWARLPGREARDLAAFLRGQYGFDLEETLDRHGLGLWRRGEGVYALPTAFTDGFNGLAVESLGLLVGEETPQGFQVSHEWTIRFGRGFTGGCFILPNDRLAAWLRGEDAPREEGDGLENGRTVLVVDSDTRILGRGKVQAQRVKNLLPRRLVSGS